MNAWKHYRGGQTTPIWIAKLSDSSIEVRIPRNNSNDFNPIWIGNTIYFLSDREGPVTLFAYDIKAKQVRQLIQNHGLTSSPRRRHPMPLFTSSSGRFIYWI